MERYKNALQVADRISRYFKGTLSEEEERQLRDWLDEVPDRKIWFDTLQESEFWHHQKQLEVLFDEKKGWNRVAVSLRRRKIRRLMKYVAMLLLPLAVCVWLWQRNVTVPTAKVLEGIELVHNNRAILELPSGERLVLTDTLAIVKRLQVQGVQLAEDHLLVYTAPAIDTLALPALHRIIVPRGGEYKVALADGSKVWLFPGSELKYPRQFTGQRRTVWLSGEAFFEVQPDAAKPFEVQTSALTVKVLGTQFNVKAYEDTDVVETSLVTGKVAIKDLVLLPDQQAVYHKQSNALQIREINGEDYLLRCDNKFVFTNRPLEEILRELSRWYDFDYFYQNPALAEKRFGFKLERFGHIDSLFHLLEQTGEIKFQLQGKTVVVMENIK